MLTFNGDSFSDGSRLSFVPLNPPMRHPPEGDMVPLTKEYLDAKFSDTGITLCLDCNTVNFEFEETFSIGAPVTVDSIIQTMNLFYGKKISDDLYQELRDAGEYDDCWSKTLFPTWEDWKSKTQFYYQLMGDHRFFEGLSENDNENDYIVNWGS